MQSSALIVLTIFAKIFSLLKSSDGNPLMGIQFQKSAYFSQDSQEVESGGATAAFSNIMIGYSKLHKDDFWEFDT